ncbi:MAG: hypothetical protein ACKERG_04595 [Candidatus Hodgkinia cicadicola]
MRWCVSDVLGLTGCGGELRRSCVVWRDRVDVQQVAGFEGSGGRRKGEAAEEMEPLTGSCLGLRFGFSYSVSVDAVSALMLVFISGELRGLSEWALAAKCVKCWGVRTPISLCKERWEE